MTTKVSAVFLILICLQLVSAQNTAVSGAEQMHFSAEDESVKRPVVLPDDAVRVLKADPNVMEMLKDQGPSTAKIPEGWLTASTVHLAGFAENDIVVVATGLLRGANVTTFWVLRPGSRGFEVLLTAPAHDLYVRRTRSKGYRDIELLSATAVDVSTISLRFDGHQYKVYARNSKGIR
jgi:hypothetical protein